MKKKTYKITPVDMPYGAYYKAELKKKRERQNQITKVVDMRGKGQKRKCIVVEEPPGYGLW